MDGWRVNDWRCGGAGSRNPDEERRKAIADDGEDQAIRRFLAATQPYSPFALRLEPSRIKPVWLLAIATVVFAVSLVWLQLAMLGRNSPLF